MAGRGTAEAGRRRAGTEEARRTHARCARTQWAQSKGATALGGRAHFTLPFLQASHYKQSAFTITGQNTTYSNVARNFAYVHESDRMRALQGRDLRWGNLLEEEN